MALTLAKLLPQSLLTASLLSIYAYRLYTLMQLYQSSMPQVASTHPPPPVLALPPLPLTIC